MGNAEMVGRRAGVVDVLPRAAGAPAMGRRAVVVELQGDAHHIEPLPLEQAGDDARIHAA